MTAHTVVYPTLTASIYSFRLLFFCAVPPTIAPFSFNKDLSEGVRAQVTCMVEKGDPPFTIAWSKDGEPIAGPSSPAGFGNTGITGPRHTQTPAGLRVTNIDAHSSTIVIERVSAAHSGNYTCLARNSVAEVLWTAELIVRGKVDREKAESSGPTVKARPDALSLFFNAVHSPSHLSVRFFLAPRSAPLVSLVYISCRYLLCAPAGSLRGSNVRWPSSAIITTVRRGREYLAVASNIHHR